jgi:hypothetical protein
MLINRQNIKEDELALKDEFNRLRNISFLLLSKENRNIFSQLQNRFYRENFLNKLIKI